MKRTLLMLLLVNLILSACAPASAPTPTPTPSATPVPTTTTAPTNTAVPTATPTPIPTIQVGDLSVLDPRVTNPELFDLTKPEAPIPQFVNAMRMAGIEITGSQVVQGITFQELKDKNKNPFVVAIYNFDPDPTQTGETLEGPIVIEISKQVIDQKIIFTDKQRDIETVLGFNVGTVLQPHQGSKDIQIRAFNRATITYNWQRREPTQGTYSLDYVNKQLNLAKSAEQPFPIRLSHISSSDTEPDWLRKIKSNEELKQVLRNQVRFIIETYSKKGVTQFNVVNEPFLSSYFPQRLGRDQYITIAYAEANKVRDELIKKAFQNNENVPVIEFGFSNAENHFAHGYGTQPTLEILKMLANNGWVDFVDVHFHIKKTSNLPFPQDVTETLNKYSQYINAITGQPIKVVVGEFDINISDIPTTDNLRLLKQAQIGQTYFNAILDAGVTDITFWGTSDYDSWYENGDLPSIEDHADALLFNDNNQPKPLNYVFIQSLLKASQ